MSGTVNTTLEGHERGRGRGLPLKHLVFSPSHCKAAHKEGGQQSRRLRGCPTHTPSAQRRSLLIVTHNWPAGCKVNSQSRGKPKLRSDMEGESCVLTLPLCGYDFRAQEAQTPKPERGQRSPGHRGKCVPRWN